MAEASSEQGATWGGLLIDRPAGGAWNMAVDEVLSEVASRRGECLLRFYSWSEPTLSLGFFQSSAQRREHPASRSCPVVRRASGGGAIVHDRELTYSLAVPAGHPLAKGHERLYRAVHQALVVALVDWGVEASLAEACPRESTERQPFLCFERRGCGDVLIGRAKACGSAQRRRQGGVLQHGSLLLARSDAAPELLGIRELTGREIPPQELILAWSGALEGHFRGKFIPGEFASEDLDVCRRLEEKKYLSEEWTHRR